MRTALISYPSRTFFCTNSEGAGHSGFHWVARIVDKATRSSVANAMEDEHAAGPGPRAGTMRDGGSEEDECRVLRLFFTPWTCIGFRRSGELGVRSMNRRGSHTLPFL
jgi:hypothetical protein